LLALALFTGLVLLCAGPVHPTTEVWGGDTSDVYNHLNLRSWQADQAAQGRLFPVNNRTLHYPDGGSIFLADALGGRLAIPLVWLGGPVLAYYLLVLGAMVFGCWASAPFWPRPPLFTTGP